MIFPYTQSHILHVRHIYVGPRWYMDNYALDDWMCCVWLGNTGSDWGIGLRHHVFELFVYVSNYLKSLFYFLNKDFDYIVDADDKDFGYIMDVDVWP